MVSIKQSRVVETLNGKVQGKTYQFEGSSASAFLGIPYAEPPVGELRFKKPVPVKNWSDVRKCTEFGNCCFYRNPTHQIRAHEDCLFLNVFVPETTKNSDESPIPILFYIHGGGFMLDSSNVLGDENICKYMCSKGIIVVTFNYRLGFFGFLTLDNDKTKGNYGMWDMALALKWVSENISSFGGDSNKITVCGQSAGAVAVDYLSLSPHSRDLFQQGITFAGTSHCNFVCMDRSYNREFAFEYAKYRGFIDNPHHSDDQRNVTLLAFYKSIRARDLALGIMPHPGFRFRSKAMIALGPVIDGDFFPKPLDELRKEAPAKHFINGTTEFEGLLFSVGSLESNHHPLVQSMATFFMRTILTPTSFMGRHLFKRIVAKRGQNKPAHETYKPLITKLFLQTRPDLTQEKAGEILDQFIDPKLDDDEYVKKAIHLISDIMFVYGAYKMSLERTKQGDKVYTYCFKYYKPGSIGLMTLLLPFEGATHCMELPYFFGKSILGEFIPDEKDHLMLDKFSSYLIQFIKTGDPNNDKYPEKWEPFDPDNHDRYFLFDNEEFGMRDGYADGRLPIWDKVFEDNPKKCGF